MFSNLTEKADTKTLHFKKGKKKCRIKFYDSKKFSKAIYNVHSIIFFGSNVIKVIVENPYLSDHETMGFLKSEIKLIN